MSETKWSMGAKVAIGGVTTLAVLGGGVLLLRKRKHDKGDTGAPAGAPLGPKAQGAAQGAPAAAPASPLASLPPPGDVTVVDTMETVPIAVREAWLPRDRERFEHEEREREAWLPRDRERFEHEERERERARGRERGR
jgi:hypothetical protein